MQYLLVPSGLFGWLDRHPEIREFLDRRFARLATDEEVCLIYSFLDPPNRRILYARDGLPVPPREYLALVAGGLGPNHFYKHGRQGAAWISDMLARNGVDLAGSRSILDFGCGCGRVIRHWPPVTRAELHGCDYNPKLVRWCRESLPFGEFKANGLEPPLPYEDDSFDVVYSLSIFTHLDEHHQVPWMQELTRVVRPGGVLLLTFHGRAHLNEAAELYEEGPQYLAAFEAGELVVWRGALSGSSGCAVWHPEAYVRDVLARGVEILEYVPSGALDIRQDAVLFRKPR
jgi:SAM-dependent methyltransferase